MRLMEDGSAYMEMSYNSEEPDSAEILKVSWKLEDGKILVSLEEGDIYLDTVDGEFVGSLDEDYKVSYQRSVFRRKTDSCADYYYTDVLAAGACAGCTGWAQNP